VCFSRGEASTLGAANADIRVIRAEEIWSAANVPRIGAVHLLDYAAGALAQQRLGPLAEQFSLAAESSCPDVLLVMDTGFQHPLHIPTMGIYLTHAALRVCMHRVWAGR
jgi:hypothetical protein